MNSPLLDTLTKAGLDPITASVYLALIELGETQVGSVQEKTALSRASVYEALSGLLAEGYVEYRKQGRVAYYKPVHPQKLEELVGQKKREVALLEGEMGETIRSLTGTFNLAFNKPGVKLYEGKEGLQEILYHSLTAKDKIFTFVNSDTVDTYLKQVDSEYVKERIKKGIKKDIIMADTPAAREYIKSMNHDLTEVKLLSSNEYPFHAAVEIYNNTLSYLTVNNDQIVAVLIDHPEIATFHKSMFRYFWNTLPSGNLG